MNAHPVTGQFEAVTQLRADLKSAGYLVVPVKTGDKKPILPAWTAVARRGEIPATNALNLSTGILCDGLRAIDIDVDDENTANQIFDIAIEMLGSGPVRVRSDSPRKLVVYRAEEGEPKKRTIVSNSLKSNDGKPSRVEVLGYGQQFVAYGTHPDGQEYEWVNGELYDFDRAELPAIHEETVSLFFEAISGLLDADLAQNNKQEAAVTSIPATQKSDYQDRETSLDELFDLLNFVSPDCGYEDWKDCLMAVHHATGGSQAGFNLVNDWSSRGKKYDGERALWKKWGSFRSSGITRATLAKIARDYGADPSRVAIDHMPGPDLVE